METRHKIYTIQYLTSLPIHHYNNITSHCVPGAVQLLALPSQLLDDIGADLIRLGCDAKSSLDALTGVGQRVGALQQQRSLRLDLGLRERNTLQSG